LSEPLGQPTGEELLRAATLALLEARRSGPGAIRSYSEALRSRIDSRGHLAEDGLVVEVLETVVAMEARMR
jgi:hypothetical protein